MLETNDKSVITSIKKVFKKKQKDFWDELTPEQKTDIEEGDRQIERGDFIHYDDLLKKYRK